MKRILACLLCGVALVATAAPKKLSPIVSMGAGGALVYDFDEHSNRVPDFSTCGYAGGDRSIPLAPVVVVVAPVAGDETARIQTALDYAGSLPLDTNGLRGAVLLLKGRHEVFGGLLITNRGVVLRGQGAGADGTVLIAAGNDRRTLIHIDAGAAEAASPISIGAHPIEDDYVPVGATRFHLKDGGGLKVGDAIRITRPSTKEWIDALGMTEFGGGIGDWRLVWKAGTRNLVWNRIVTSVTGDEVTIDAPITTAIEKSLGGGTAEIDTSTPVTEVGVENLRLQSEFDPQNIRDENHSWMAITMENTADAWVRQVTFEHFAGSAVALYETCRRITVEDCLSLAPVSEDAGWRRNTFYTMGQQTLFLRCFAEYGRHDFAVGFCAAGPNAFVQCEVSLPTADSGAIESWSAGTLFDNVRIDGGALSLMNRGSDSEGAGWSAANSVLWQCDASKISCENPPGARNFAFGCWGEFAGNGVWRQANASVRPVSLYVAQLADRRGAAAAEEVKLMPRSLEEYSNPTPAQAAKLIANSRLPAPQINDYIAAASTRDPIASDPGDAKRMEDIPSVGNEPTVATHLISITNGWLVCDGKLLTGTTLAINWWRGNMHPGEAKSYGVNLSRFAPGRTGAGLTDDLNALADSMSADHEAALDHHYGLWYDRRREDHERVRRMDADAWAPFYEQPFARSGQDRAWDGLSKYDLTKFNPWYWKRLESFAAICDQRGLVLFNENYFQHNIIEAGAHWVDCPWRTANNINHTSFPEPPPFAGDKRIFMAEQFYDVSDPAYRVLHRNFIRQNLDNFTNHANVIQFTSAEFTGPLAFEQFWLDTIRDWKNDTGQKLLVALSCPKNVQDAILADPQRSAVVDIICFRYWWQTDRGLFAPDGGKNLSPRQFERLWKGGTPSDLNLAAMAAEYRQKFLDKVVIASGEDEDMGHSSWAFVCAGGSLPNLPASTDGKLLAAVPQMQPWPDVSGPSRWALRQPGQQILIHTGDHTPVDLSAETGSFQVRVVDPETGAVGAPSSSVQAGGKVTLPAGVVWLTRE